VADELPVQVPSPGDLTRVAVSPDASVWCIDTRGDAWVMRTDFVWKKVVFHEPAKDVDVSADKTAWFVMRSERYFVQPPGDTQPRYVACLLSMHAMTGIEAPADGPTSNAGRAWGVAPQLGDGALAFSDGIWRPGQCTIMNVDDLSTAPSALWMVKTDGTVWTTIDGRTQLRRGNLIAKRVAGDFNDCAYCVAPDGRAWKWGQFTDPPPAPAPTPPQPVPPPSSSQSPSINVSTAGGGLGTVFKITGSGFLNSVQVTIRGVRIGDGEIGEFYWLTSSSASGIINFDTPLPCVPGVVIHFSANDGRRDANLTERLWSNTVPASCPPG
jgi:hypothetical protein